MRREPIIILLAAAAITLGMTPLQKAVDFNFGFERVGSKGNPLYWSGSIHGDSASCTSEVKHSGSYSLHLKVLSDDLPSLCAVRLLPFVRGKIVTYGGWIKTKEVEQWAGLWMRVDGVDPANESEYKYSPHPVLAFNNMQDSAFHGTHDWTHFSYRLPVSDTAKNIDFGVLVVGKGEAWFDDLTLDTNGVRFADSGVR